MRIDSFAFGQITIDGVAYEHDVIIDQYDLERRNHPLLAASRDNDSGR